MGRILKLLTGALEQCKGGSSLYLVTIGTSLIPDGEMLSLGDVSDLSPNASVMLKISILAAWAELQVASQRQTYLNEVIKPYRWLLGPFWVGSLRDYAGLRTDPDMGSGGMGMDTSVAREVLLPVCSRYDFWASSYAT